MEVNSQTVPLPALRRRVAGVCQRLCFKLTQGEPAVQPADRWYKRRTIQHRTILGLRGHEWFDRLLYGSLHQGITAIYFSGDRIPGIGGYLRAFDCDQSQFRLTRIRLSRCEQLLLLSSGIRGSL